MAAQILHWRLAWLLELVARQAYYQCLTCLRIEEVTHPAFICRDDFLFNGEVEMLTIAGK
jgi:hypothetical protein